MNSRNLPELKNHLKEVLDNLSLLTQDQLDVLIFSCEVELTERNQTWWRQYNDGLHKKDS